MPPRMHRLTLAFDDPAWELAYLITRRRIRFRAPVVLSLLITVAVYLGAAAILGRLLPTDRLIVTILVGSAASLQAVVLVATLLLPVQTLSRFFIAAVPTMVVVNSAALILLHAILGERFAPFGAVALSLHLLGVHSFINLRFVHATALCWASIAAHFIVIIGVTPLPAQTVLTHALWLVVSQALGMRTSYNDERSRRRAFQQARRIEEEQAKSEQLLRNILPEAIAERLKRGPGAIADGFEGVTVLFADIVGFTPLSQRIPPAEVVRLLNEVFSRFDAMALSHGLEKIKTIGDAYMVVGGLPSPRPDHAAAVARMALEMRDAMSGFGDGKLALRIGMDSGPVVAGVIGKSKYSYDLWGDTVNTASRMESHGQPGEIHVTDSCRELLGIGFALEERGLVDIKGKGPMRTWWLKSQVAPP
jgi:class 3 adenylate cyclase